LNYAIDETLSATPTLVNVAAYPKWQAWLQKTQPKLLVVWGKYDPSFDMSDRKPIGAMCRTLKSTFSMPVISH
jgi:hypothetical protein